jgi:hypothetical protein
MQRNPGLLFDLLLLLLTSTPFIQACSTDLGRFLASS